MKTKVETRQDLLYLLAQASELEHSLTCQYLYAAFSLKLPGEPGVTDEQASVIAEWRKTMISIAVQEMLHLGLAANLLTAVGGAPYLRRANFPQKKTYTTLNLDFRLAGVSPKTVRRFCCFELPPELSPNSVYAPWKDTCKQVKDRSFDLAALPPLLPQPFDYTSIGALYGLIEDGFKSLYPEDASKLFIGPPTSQTVSMWKTMMAVTNRDEAVEAIDLILRQGEGAYGNDEEIKEAHFGKFVSIYEALENGTGGTEPAYPVVENPVLTLHEDIAYEVDGEMLRPTVITSEVGKSANEIFVSLYELALQVLLRYFANANETPEQRYVLSQLFLSIMRYCLTPLGTAIARVPAFDNNPDGPRAGASFEFYSDTLLLPHLDSAWRYFEERLREISAAAKALASSASSEPFPLLRKALVGAPEGSTAAEAAASPGVAAVCAKYVVGVSSGRRPPGEWTWENGVRAFFSPLDVQRMLPHGINLSKEDDVRNEKEDISRRIGKEASIRMPPQFLLEDETAASEGYRNPYGPWTDERIANFRTWAGLTPDDFVCPENLTWESAVKNWFNPRDVSHMQARGLDLSNYEDVVKNIDSISSAIETKFMPPGGWSNGQIACFKKWVDAGTPKGEKLTWRKTSAGPTGSRYDDIFFITRDIGWAVNSDGKVLHTRDSGTTWTTLATIEDVEERSIYLRCIEFANENVGYLGTISTKLLTRRIFKTTDGGKTWIPFENLPEEAPLKVCGLTVVNENVVYATGTNEPSDFAAIMKTTDGGETWTAKSLEEYASILIDNHFFDERRGLVVGGYTDVPHGERRRSDMVPVILQTEDGGETWVNLLKDFTSDYPFGEWGWKIFVLNENVIFVSQENFNDGAISKTADGGKTWERIHIGDDQNEGQGNANLEGVGFISEDVGWVGGWGDAVVDLVGGFTSATNDGGKTWRAANEVGLFLNRFRFYGSPVDLGFACGDFIYKYSSEPVPITTNDVAAATESSLILEREEERHVVIPVKIRFVIPPDSKQVRLHVWNQFAKSVITLLAEENPSPGERAVQWDGLDEDGKKVKSGPYIYRLQVDNHRESRVLFVDA